MPPDPIEVFAVYAKNDEEEKMTLREIFMDAGQSAAWVYDAILEGMAKARFERGIGKRERSIHR